MIQQPRHARHHTCDHGAGQQRSGRDDDSQAQHFHALRMSIRENLGICGPQYGIMGRIQIQYVRRLVMQSAEVPNLFNNMDKHAFLPRWFRACIRSRKIRASRSRAKPELGKNIQAQSARVRPRSQPAVRPVYVSLPRGKGHAMMPPHAPARSGHRPHRRSQGTHINHRLRDRHNRGNRRGRRAVQVNNKAQGYCHGCRGYCHGCRM